MNRLAILEDNLEFSRNLLNYILDHNKRVRLLRLAVTAQEIIEHEDELGKGDILILDLGLPDMNGLEVIDHFRQSQKFMPYIIVISGNPQLYEKIEANYLPYVYACIQKPFDLKRIVEIMDQITYETSIHCYEELVKNELHKFDMNVTTKGYAYIVEAITLSLEDETLLADMSHGLYKMIALQHNITVNNVKWAIEKTLRSILRFTNSHIINSYFYVVGKEKVTPKMFISVIVENLKEKLEEEEYA